MDRVSDTRAWPKRLRLADDFWFVAHDDASGRSRLGAVALGLGLAGALLGELVVSGSVAVSSGRILALNARPLLDPDYRAIVQHMLSEPQHDLRTWLSYLSHGAEDTVAARLLRAGVVTRESQRRVFTTAMVHRPVEHRHAEVDHVRWPAYLEASNTRSRKPYDRPGYRDCAPSLDLPHQGEPLFPMWREPARQSSPDGDRAS